MTSMRQGLHSDSGKSIGSETYRAGRRRSESLPPFDVESLKKRIKELEHHLERKTIEVEILKDSLERQKKGSGC